MIVCLLLTGVVLISKPPFIFKVRVTHVCNFINCTLSRSIILPNIIDHLVFVLNNCIIHRVTQISSTDKVYYVKNQLLGIPWRELQNIHSITMCLPSIKHAASTVIPMDSEI
jgi:hypothetical protein